MNEKSDMSLLVRCFGGLELENRHGRAAENLMRPSHSWQLLKYLLLSRGGSVDVDELCETLWPDEVDHGGTLMRVRLRRLREALAPLGLGGVRDGLVLYSYGKYYLNSDYELRFEEDEYKAILEKLRAMPMDEPEGLGLCCRALELQRGQYMGERNDGNWLRPMREHYRREFVYLAYNTLGRTKLLGDNRALELLCSRTVGMVPEEENLHRAVVGYLVEQRREHELIRYITRLSRVDGSGAKWLNELGY